MKALNHLFLGIFFILSNVLTAQIISTFPYSESFDSFPLVYSGNFGAEPNLLINNWVNVQVDSAAQDWYVRSGATPSSGTGPNGDHTSGNGRYLYMEDSFNNTV